MRAAILQRCHADRVLLLRDASCRLLQLRRQRTLRILRCRGFHALLRYRIFARSRMVRVSRYSQYQLLFPLLRRNRDSREWILSLRGSDFGPLCRSKFFGRFGRSLFWVRYRLRQSRRLVCSHQFPVSVKRWMTDRDRGYFRVFLPYKQPVSIHRVFGECHRAVDHVETPKLSVFFGP